MSGEGRARTVDAAGAERHEARRKQAHCTPAHTGRIYSAQPAAVSTRAVRENPALLSAGRRLRPPALAVVRASELSSERPRPRGGSPRLRAPAALARAALVRPPPPRQALGLSFAPGPALPASEPARDQPRNQRQLPTGSQPAARGPGCASLGGASASRCSTHATKPSAAAVRSRV